MGNYPEPILELCARETVEPCGPPSAEGRSASFVCGCFVGIRLYDGENGAVEARMRTNGCGFMAAAAVVLTDFVAANSPAELKGLGDEVLSDVVFRSGGFKVPPDRIHCVNAASEALRRAFRELRSRRVAEFAGERQLICTCFGIGEDEIEAAVWKLGLAEAEDVSAAVRAGSGCGSCVPLIREIIDSVSARA